MKIAYSRFDPISGHFSVAVSGSGVESLRLESELRCGAYRFVVRTEPVAYDSPDPTVSLLLSGKDEPVEGMVLHPALEPLTDEELTIAIQHLFMLPNMLKGIDALGVAQRVRLAKLPTLEQRQHLSRLVSFCEAVADATEACPPDARLFEMKRYQSELVKACL